MPLDAQNEHSDSRGEAGRVFCWPAELTANVFLRSRSYHYKERRGAFFSVYRVVEQQQEMDFSPNYGCSLSPSVATLSVATWAPVESPLGWPRQEQEHLYSEYFQTTFPWGRWCPLLPRHTRLPAHPGRGWSRPPPPGSLPCPHKRAPRHREALRPPLLLALPFPRRRHQGSWHVTPCLRGPALLLRSPVH